MAQGKVSNKLKSQFLIRNRIHVPEETLRQARQLYDRGWYVDATRLCLQMGDMQAWKGGAAQTFGFRLAGNVGATRLASLLISRAYREAPSHPDVSVHYGYHLQHQQGPLKAWNHALRSEALSGMTPDALSNLKLIRARVASGYRDFGKAWQLWDEAQKLSEDRAWLWVEKAQIELSQEAREAALESLNKALEIQPFYRPAVQQKGRLLHLLSRWDEAIEFLATSMKHLQSYAVAAQLMSLKREVDDSEGMAELADQVESLAVLMEPGEKEWLQARRADIFYLKGDRAAAAEISESISGTYYPAFAKRLRDPAQTSSRKRLPFEFVHQKHNTCAPATLAAITHFWNRPIAMEQIVDAICYDGTYDYSEREWGEANGFAVREFTVTLASTKALIEGGVPFVISTVEVGSAHAQAIIGYDQLRETLFIQDPSEPHYREIPATEFLEGYRLTGPRGLVLVPQEKADWLMRLDLPDADLLDNIYHFNKALSVYDRRTAIEILTGLENQAPGHRLVCLAKMSVAGFDGNELARSEGIDQLLLEFPEDARVLNWKIFMLRTLGHREERLNLLRKASTGDSAHPSFIRELGIELMEDARDWPEARRCLWRAHAIMPGEAKIIVYLADLLQRTHAATGTELLHYYGFAAALSDKVESYAKHWFSFAVSQGKTEEALDWLRRRQRDYGDKSGEPAMTLVEALDRLGRAEMLEVIREAVKRRPDDGALLLYLARLECRLGEFEKAQQLLEQARGKTYPGAWSRAHAAILRRKGAHAEELEVWRDILTREPLALDAHGVMAKELAATQGTAAALNHLEAICTRFPHHSGLGQLWVQWLRESDPYKAAEQTRHIIQRHPSDPWGHRELALITLEIGKREEAVAAARQAVILAPDQAASHGILGISLIAVGDPEKAAQSLHRSIELDVNYAASYDALISLPQGTQQRRQELAFIREQMIRQVLNGNGLHAYRAKAFGVLEPEELVDEMREIWQARPDLWEAWSSLIGQLLDTGVKEEAFVLAQQATEKFPLLPGAWRDLATVQRLRNDLDGAIQTMQKAMLMNPDWTEGWQQLAENLDDAGRSVEAVETLRRALVRLPLDMGLRGSLAIVLWRTGFRQEAWDIAQQVAQQDPGQQWAWNNLQVWAPILLKQEELTNQARQLTHQRSKEARSWHVLARVLPFEQVAEILAALNQAIQLNPRLVDAYDYRAEILARLGRFDEAEDSLKQGPWDTQSMPSSLSGRSAWLKAVRGNLLAAIQEMRSLLEIHTDYYWGWEMLSNWAEERKNISDWRRATSAMVRLNPRSAAPYCSAAELELHCQFWDKAVQYLKQALDIDPSSSYAAHRLLDYYWTKREFENLRKTAATLTDDGTVGLVKRTYLMLCDAQDGNHEKTRFALIDLAIQPDMLGPLLDLILEYFQQKKRTLSPLLDEVLQKVSDEKTIGPAFAILWVRRIAQKKEWHRWDQLGSWIARLGPRLDTAIGTYLDLVGDAGEADPHVILFIKQHGAELRQRGLIWGKVGYALTNSGAFRACSDWLLEDYTRPDAEGWVLSNLVVCLRCSNQGKKAFEVSAHVVRQGLEDGTWPLHVATTAHGEADSGLFDESRQTLARADLSNSALEWRLLGLIAQALSDVMPRPGKQGRAAFKQFLAASKRLIGDKVMSGQTQRDYERAVERMKLHTGVMVLPWQKTKFREVQSGWGAGISKAALWLGLFLALQSLRLCNPSTGSSSLQPRSSDDFLNDQTGKLSPFIQRPMDLPPIIPIEDKNVRPLPSAFPRTFPPGGISPTLDSSDPLPTEVPTLNDLLR